MSHLRCQEGPPRRDTLVEPCKVTRNQVGRRAGETVQLAADEAAVRRTERSLVRVAGEGRMACEVTVAKMSPESQAGPSTPW